MLLRDISWKLIVTEYVLLFVDAQQIMWCVPNNLNN